MRLIDKYLIFNVWINREQPRYRLFRKVNLICEKCFDFGRETKKKKKGGKIKLHFYPKWVETSSQEEKNFWTTVMCLLFFITRRYDFGVLLSDFRSE